MIKCIVRMEMPRNCGECPISYQTYGYGKLCWCKSAFEKNEAVIGGLMWKVANPDQRPDWCPIEREFVTCEDCEHSEAAEKGCCMYDIDMCIGGRKKDDRH